MADVVLKAAEGSGSAYLGRLRSKCLASASSRVDVESASSIFFEVLVFVYVCVVLRRGCVQCGFCHGSAGAAAVLGRQAVLVAMVLRRATGLIRRRTAAHRRLGLCLDRDMTDVVMFGWSASLKVRTRSLRWTNLPHSARALRCVASEP